MCNMQELYLNNNKIGDPGIIALADALGKGALPALQELSLSYNQIGDTGMAAFAGAVSKGALASLKKIVVDAKHERHPQLLAACQPRGIEIA